MTILFSIYSPKIPSSNIFDPKFRHICFFVKFCKQTKLKVQISNMTIVLLKLWPKNTQIQHFWSKIPKSGFFGPKFRHFYYFTKFRNQTNSRVLISKMTIGFLKLWPKNTQIRHFWSKYPNQAFLVPNLKIFILH